MWITTRIRKHTHFIERNNTYGTSWAQRLHRPLFQTGNWEDRYECASTGEAEFVLLVACDTDKHHRGHGRPVTADRPIPSRTIHFLKLWCRLRREKQGCDHAADIFCQMLSPRTKKFLIGLQLTWISIRSNNIIMLSITLEAKCVSCAREYDFHLQISAKTNLTKIGREQRAIAFDTTRHW